MAKPSEPTTTICRLRVPLSTGAWMGVITREHPEISIEVLGHVMAKGNESTVELRVHGENARELGEALRRSKGVREVELVEVRKNSAEFRIVHTAATLLRGLSQVHLMPRFPFFIRQGAATWVIVASEAKVKELYRFLAKETPGVTIESLRHGGEADELSVLTPRQREIFLIAMTRGYYEVPRGISLTGLAEELGVAKSTLSESLANVERKILKDVVQTSTRL